MLLLLLFASLSWSAIDEAEVKQIDPAEHAETCAAPTPNSVAALNNERMLDGKLYPAGTEIYFDEDGQAVTFDANENLIELKVSATAFSCKDVTVIPQNPITGELEDYNIPMDKQVTGPGGKKKKRKGVTHCYRAVKAFVRKKITLSGEAAYMAAPQLRRAGYKQYSYKAAPRGAICVFNPGGKHTASGGQKYGHIGIKGQGGIINPEAGFALHRPFVGCFAKA